MNQLNYDDLEIILTALTNNKIQILGRLQQHEESMDEIANHGLKEFIKERDDKDKEQLKKIDRLIDKVIDMQIKR